MLAERSRSADDRNGEVSDLAFPIVEEDEMRKFSGPETVAFVVSMFMTAISAQQGPPKPSVEMAQLSFMAGSWTCSGKTFETPMGPAGPMTSTADIRQDLGGHFQSGTIKGTATGMPPFEGRFHTTYDPGKKQFVMLWVDNMGGYAQTTSSGWKGDTMVYEGQGNMAGQTISSRDTFTKSAAGMKHTWEIQVNGKWTPAGEETCQKKK